VLDYDLDNCSESSLVCPWRRYANLVIIITDNAADCASFTVSVPRITEKLWTYRTDLDEILRDMGREQSG